ncbi:O-antigen/teichoic acid export membrane protein [Gordonia amarae]|uniref:lipopolysaccharide biosynthesis protein n=1 Tax=Gordonia amarae TaxID=36821 RepID=UPI00147837AA|nr:oligosaccharide flippase family protein [Gordonia amarae]MCS3879150.1 O-antigen/teichoic acid export membrane protein [Gordonia amarae]
MSPSQPGIARNSLAVAISGIATAGLGLIYWIVIGRLYPATEVGAAAAVVFAASMLAAFGNLGLGAYFERFLPVAGPASARLLTDGLAVGVLFGGLLAAGFLAFGPVEEMFADVWQMAFFPVAVASLSLFALIDHVCIGLQRAEWSAAKNIVHAVVKLVAAAAVAAVAGRQGIVATWVLTALIGAVILWVIVIREIRRRAVVPVPQVLPSWRDQRRFIVGNYGIYVASSLTPLLLPMIVIGQVGAGQNAYFAMVWQLITAVIVLLTMLIGPYVAEASAGSTDLRHLTYRFIAIMMGVAGAATAGLSTIGPLFLRLAGDDYADNGTPLLRVASAALPLAAVGLIFVAVSRVRNRLWPALAAQVAGALVNLGLATALLGGHGIVAVGWSTIASEALIVLLVIVPLIRGVRAFVRTGPTPDQESVRSTAPGALSK